MQLYPMWLLHTRQRADQDAEDEWWRKGKGPAGRRPGSLKLVSALTALEEPSGGLDPWPGDGVGVRGGPGDLQRRQLFGQDLAVDAAGRGGKEPTASEE